MDACSYDKNITLVARFIGSTYRYFSVFCILIVGSVLFFAAGYVAYPNHIVL